MKRAFIALTLGVLAASGCRKPEGVPPFDQRLSEAVAVGEQVVPKEDREAYRQGFVNGARMVEAAVVAHRRPYVLRVGTNSGALLPKQHLPEGVTVVEDAPPDVEMDSATGLEIVRFAQTEVRGFTKGQVDGFQWAFEPRRAELAKPRPEPSIPSTWTANSKAPEFRVNHDQVAVTLIWSSGLLRWTRTERGFPSQRMWRPASEWMKPYAVALGKDAVWIDTDRGALALDLDSGMIRSVKPRPEPSQVEDMNWERTPAQVQAEEAQRQAEADKARPALLERASKGDADAMVELAWDTEDIVERAQLYRKAAELGNPQGMYEVAVRCFQGRGIPEDKAEAKRWFEKAAALGHQGAKEALEGLFPMP